jgi:acetyl esterase
MSSDVPSEPLDPTLERVLAMMRKAPGSSGDLDAASLRELTRTSMRFLSPPERRPEVGVVRGVDAGGVPARLFTPEGTGPWPTVLHLHGGGFVTGDLDTYDHTIRRLCRDAEAAVLSVDYRLAPEHPFPAGVEDAIRAARWAADHLADLGGTDVLAVSGDSAGGNLAAVVAQELREVIAAQVLIYPVLDHGRRAYASRKANGSGYGLERDQMSFYRTAYLPDEGAVDLDDPRLSPIVGDLAGLPPALVVTAGYDPLRDEGEAYVAALCEVGVEAELLRFGSLVHGFTEMGVLSEACDLAHAEIVERTRLLLARVSAG